MIQLNLLPDVKLEYIKAQRQRRLIMSISIIATVAAIALVALLTTVNIYQKARLNSLSNDIASEVKELKGKPQIDKILTVQNQLNSITKLHMDKPAASNVFNYLNQVTPEKVSISEFTADFTNVNITITGESYALSNVNKYIDTLKFTKFSSDQVEDKKPAFSSVVMTDFGINDQAEDPSQAVHYTIKMNYDPAIFDISQKVTLDVPSIVTTRSELDRPTDLFKIPVKSSNKGNQ